MLTRAKAIRLECETGIIARTVPLFLRVFSANDDDKMYRGSRTDRYVACRKPL